MAARLSRKRLPRYGLDFKVKAVRLTRIPIPHLRGGGDPWALPAVMLGRGRQEFREGRLKDVAPRPAISKRVVREIQRLQELEKAHRLLIEEHELLKQAIRFCSERRPTYSRSSKLAARTSR